jgi:hypothetical protein
MAMKKSIGRTLAHIDVAANTSVRIHEDFFNTHPCSQQLSERTRLSAGYLHYSNPHSALQQMLVMKSISKLVVMVKPSERHTVIQKDAAIRHIQSSYGNAIFLREAFPE